MRQLKSMLLDPDVDLATHVQLLLHLKNVSGAAPQLLPYLILFGLAQDPWIQRPGV